MSEAQNQNRALPTEDELETLVRDKIEGKLQSYNGEWLAALRLFNNGGHATREISFEQFHKTLCGFLLVDISVVESRRLFNKYDKDGSGSLDCHEFVLQLLPGPHSNTCPANPTPELPREEMPAYVRRCGAASVSPPRTDAGRT